MGDPMARVINTWPVNEQGQPEQGEHVRGDAEDPVRCWCSPSAATQDNGWIIVTHANTEPVPVE
jgi:hypothetical protein